MFATRVLLATPDLRTEICDLNELWNDSEIAAYSAIGTIAVPTRFVSHRGLIYVGQDLKKISADYIDYSQFNDLY